jgi:hypothetical protein
MEAIRMTTPRAHQGGAEHYVACLVDRRGDGWVIDADGLRLTATAARSCLLEPAVGDRALILVSGSECWILSILERTGQTDSRLRFPGDLGIDLEDGSLSLRSRRSMTLSSDESVRVEAPMYTLCANAAEHFVHGVSWVGRKLSSTFDSIRTIGKSMETLARTRREHSRHSIRSVEEIDKVTSGQIDYRAEEKFAIRGKNIVAKGRELAKVDAKQIQLG